MCEVIIVPSSGFIQVVAFNPIYSTLCLPSEYNFVLIGDEVWADFLGQYQFTMENLEKKFC